MSQQVNIYKAVIQCIAIWTNNIDEHHKIGMPIHPDALIVVMDEDGNYTNHSGNSFRFTSSDHLEFHITKIQIVPVGNQSLASALVTSQNYCGWVVLLDLGQWQCISGTFSPPGQSVTPIDHQEVIHLIWDGYCRANRDCDGDEMAKVFHELCRLTEAADVVDGKDHISSTATTSRRLFLKNQVDFCSLVANRYNDPTNRHYPYRHLRNNHSVVSRYDSLVSIEFATDRLAFVTLKVGHPPCLWTDFLTVAKFASKWWIIHKSSCAETFPLEGVEAKLL